MKKEQINRKLLAECLRAAHEGKLDKAKRLFARNWHDSYVTSYKMLEEAEGSDEEFISDEFSDEVISDFEDNAENKYEEAQFAADEIEDKAHEYLEDDAEETIQKIDDLRNVLDELSASSEVMAESDEDCDCEEKENDARVIIEDIKADFEAKMGELPEDVADIFVEFDKVFEEEPVEDEADVEPADEELTEDVEDMELVDDIEVEEPAEEEVADDEEEPFDEEEFKDILLDIRDSQEELEAKFDELNSEKKEEKLDEEWVKLKVERNGAKNEEEGVNKKSMNFNKVKRLDSKASLNVSHTDSKGESAQAKIKGSIGKENKGLKGYEKIAVDNKGK